MKDTFKRLVVMLLSLIMVLGATGMVSFADEPEDTSEEPTSIWYGDSLSVDIVEGTEGYTFMALFRKPAHGYEFSGHFMGDGEGPQTFVLIDTVEHANTTWKPSGKYVSGSSNYEVVYCCDVETMIQDGTYYKRLNLEDSEYFDEKQAAKLRAVVKNSYPYVSMEEMVAELKANGFEGAEDLKVGEVIAAVQTAIWSCSNNIEPLRYSKSYSVLDNYQWGQPLNDVTPLSGLDVSGKRVFKTYDEVGKRIDSLVDYLLAREEININRRSAVVTGLEILDYAPVIAKNGVYTVVVKVQLNHIVKEGDDVTIDLSVNGEEAASINVIPGTTEYIFAVEAKAGEAINAVVSGEQHLNTGVYFYSPRPVDVDGDGVATGREVSQNLIGVAGGKTPIYSEASVELELPENDPVTGTLNLKKVNWKGEGLTGAAFDLYINTQEGKLNVGKYFVDENGNLAVENLVPGSYELAETVVPTGFVDPKAAVKFTIDDEGKLTVEESDLVTFKDGVVVVENKRIPTEITLGGIKYLDEEVAPGFRFTLSYAGQYISTVVSDDNGIFDFGSFLFDEEGTYIYTIKEVIDAEDEEILYDESEYTVTVVVTLEGVELKANVSIEKDGAAHEGEIRFDNYTTPDIPNDPPPRDSPETGDNTILFALLGLIAVIGAGFTFKKRRAF